MRNHLTAAALGLLALAFTFGCLEEEKSPSLGSSSSGLTGTSGTFIDVRDNKPYKWVKIGEQFWMAQNLAYQFPGSKCYGEGGKVVKDVIFKPADNQDGVIGVPIITTISSSQVQANCVKYGRLYNWAMAMAFPAKCNKIRPTSVALPSSAVKSNSALSTACVIATPHQGICPTGWHIPSYEEWYALFTLLVDGTSDTVGKYLKAKSGWNSNGNGVDKYGFAALPGGKGSKGDFGDIGKEGYWQSASTSEYNDNYVRFWGMRYNEDFFYGNNEEKSNLLSVRCLKD